MRPRRRCWRAWPLALGLAFAAAAGCGSWGAGSSTPGTAPEPGSPAPSPARLTLLHMNDVYEIAPLEGGAVGGLARVATLRRRLLSEDPHALTLLGGDFLGPSALGTSRVDGEPLAGRQMVAVLNVLGLDLATLGNHEFDLNEERFRARIDESEFEWIAANVTDPDGNPYAGIVPSVIRTVPREGADSVRIGIVGLVTPVNQPGYVRITDPLPAARAEVARLRDSVHVLIALTHLRLSDDRALVERVPGIDLVLGGHEHDNVEVWPRPGVPVVKADANARTVYVVRVELADAGVRVETELVTLDDRIPAEPRTDAEVDRWLRLGYAGFRELGLEPERVVAHTTMAFDGTDEVVRRGPNPLGSLVADAMRVEAAGSEAAVFNSGSIRIDDVLPAGPVTEYDLIRVLPFGGAVRSVTMTGDLLGRLLEAGEAAPGSGAYLLTSGIDRTDDGWVVDGTPLTPQRRVRVATSDFLISGREQGMEFLTPAHPGLDVGAAGRDVRFALRDELRRRYPP